MKRKETLSSIQDFLKSQKNTFKNIWIPEIWNEINSKNVIKQEKREIMVNPFLFYNDIIDYIIENEVKDFKHDEHLNFKNSGIYCGMPRYTTAWDTEKDGGLTSGTFLRMMALLPIMKNMGVNILYLLPITEYSSLYKKGDIGAPFAMRDYFELDPNLHDPVLDGMEGINVKTEFKALVEAAHLLGIKVVLDFIPRVTARNSSLINDNPDWVYWIKMEHLDGFAPPEIPGFDTFTECTPDKIEKVYSADSTKEHLTKFVASPDKYNPELYQKLKKQSQETGEDLLTLIENEMGITTPPAHSDWMNDVQPVWTDITFLRLYMDTTPLAKPFLDDDQVPYVMFDTIKANKFPGEVPNQGLWDLFKEVLEFYVKEYDVDGFRFDIGHTIPPVLLQGLFKTVKDLKPNAVLISEDLFNRNHEDAAKAGYNVMLGSGWNEMARISKENLMGFLQELPELKLHTYAGAETHDTPRIVTREGGVHIARMTGVFNKFLPNGVFFISTGYEINENQPINCGLADNTGGAEIPKAFFNKMKMDWTNESATHMLDMLEELDKIKNDKLRYLDADKFKILNSPDDTIVYSYKDGHDYLVFCFNLNLKKSIELHIEELISEDVAHTKYNYIFDSNMSHSGIHPLDEHFTMEPGEAIILETIHD